MRDSMRNGPGSAALAPTRPRLSVSEAGELTTLAALTAHIRDLTGELLACAAAREEQEIRWADREIAYLLGGRPDESTLSA